VICVIHEPVHGEECGKRVKRGLLKRTKLSKVLNADLAEACNILIAPGLSQGLNLSKRRMAREASTG